MRGRARRQRNGNGGLSLGKFPPAGLPDRFPGWEKDNCVEIELRQGDTGSYRQYMSLDDDIVLAGLGPRQAERLKEIGKRRPGDCSRFARLLRQAQRKVERNHFHARKILLYHEHQRQLAQREMGQDPYIDTLS